MKKSSQRTDAASSCDFRTSVGPRILIANGTLIDPGSNRKGSFDVLLEDGKVAAVEPKGGFKSLSGVEIVDASAKWVIPGLVDVHVHLREPGFEWKETIESGARAAIFGGFTTICCMPNTKPVNDRAEIVRFIRERSREAGGARVLPIGAVSMGLEGKELALLGELHEAGCVAFSDDGEPVYNAGMMRRALEWARMLDVPICAHEEDKTLSCGGCMNESALSLKMGLRGWPKVAEEVMIARDIELARTTGSRVHFCHVSTARGVELLKRAKEDGIRVSGEVTPHHLLLTEERVRNYDTNAKMSPPLRHQEDCEALVQGLQEGILDCVASDHAPHHWDAKETEFDHAAFGILGVQTSLPLLLGLVREGRLSPERAVEALSTGPARALKLPDCGSLAPGASADLVVVDPELEWELSSQAILSKSRNTPWLNERLKGRAVEVFVRGVRYNPETGRRRETQVGAETSSARSLPRETSSMEALA